MAHRVPIAICNGLSRKPCKPANITSSRTAKTHCSRTTIYYENAKAKGLMPWLFEGTRTVSIGRYFPPNIGQLVFETKKGLSVSLTAILTPVDHNLTQPFALFSIRRVIAPAWLKRWVLKGFNYPLLKQDQHMLEHQVDTLEKTGQVDFTVGPMDLLGPTIWRLANEKPQPETRAFFEPSESKGDSHRP